MKNKKHWFFRERKYTTTLLHETAEAIFNIVLFILLGVICYLTGILVGIVFASDKIAQYTYTMAKIIN